MTNPFNQPPGKQEQIDIKVRLATPDEWAICKELRLRSLTGPSARAMGMTTEVLEQEFDKTDADWKKETSSEDMFSVLAFSGPKAVGLGRTRRVEENIWRIRNGWVDPGFEKLGIQTKLIALRLQEVIKRGGNKAITSVILGNDVSLHNVMKFGFKILSVEKDDMGDDWNFLGVDLNDPEVIKKVNEVLNVE